METVREVWDFVMREVFPYWPGIGWVLISVIISQTLKVRVLHVELARKYPLVFWIRRVFPLIVLALGTLVGSFWPDELYPNISQRVHKIMYFTAGSGISIIGFNVFKQWVKKKYDVELWEARSSIAPEGYEGSEEITKRVER